MPLCVGCGKKEVNRCYDNRVKPQVVDGLNWRQFCSKTCAGRYNMGTVSQDARNRLAFGNRKRATDRLITRIRGEFGPDIQVNSQLAQFILKECRVQYQRGYTACQNKLKYHGEWNRG